jgi:hypothetical protein
VTSNYGRSARSTRHIVLCSQGLPQYLVAVLTEREPPSQAVQRRRTCDQHYGTKSASALSCGAAARPLCLRYGHTCIPKSATGGEQTFAADFCDPGWVLIGSPVRFAPRR